MQKRVIFLNAPPGAGKDEVANHLVAEHGFHSLKFAQPLRDAACALFDLDESKVEKWKRKKIGKSHTGRDFMIGLSEGIIKPMLGEDWFGVRVAESILKIDNESQFIVSDCGFKHELLACVNKLREASGDAWKFDLWHIHRNGHDFKGDSRSFVYIKSIPAITIENNSTLESLYGKIDELILWNNQPISNMGTATK